MNRNDRVSWVRRAIDTRPDRAPRVDGGKLWIRCPSPQHKGGQERTPSLAINIDAGHNARGFIGNFRCFGCGWRGDWNMLASSMGLQQWEGQVLGDGVQQAFPVLVDATELMVTRDADNEWQDTVPWPINQSWRTINGRLCHDLGGRMRLVKDEMRLVFPVNVFEQTRGTITCALEKVAGEKSYVNSKGAWAHRAMFPYDYVRKMVSRQPMGRRFVAVVEGPRDALYWIQHGIPALATIGSYTAWTDDKARLVLDMEPDLTVLAFDGDEIGRRARALASKSFQGYTRLRAFNFSEGDDPASLDTDQMRWVKSQISGWLRQQAA